MTWFLQQRQRIKTRIICKQRLTEQRERIRRNHGNGLSWVSLWRDTCCTGISDRLRTSSGKSTGKICLDRIYDGVTYLSCRANNVYPWYKWRAHHQPYVYVHTYVHVWKILLFFQKQLCCVKSEHIHISLVSNLFLCSSVRWEDCKKLIYICFIPVTRYIPFKMYVYTMKWFDGKIL